MACDENIIIHFFILFLFLQVGHIPIFVDQVMSNDTSLQLDGITRIRILLRGNFFLVYYYRIITIPVFYSLLPCLYIFLETVDPPFDEVLAEGAVLMFVNFLNRTDTPELQVILSF